MKENQRSVYNYIYVGWFKVMENCIYISMRVDMFYIKFNNYIKIVLYSLLAYKC